MAHSVTNRIETPKQMIEIKPIQRCNASVTLPGSKSYTHRALLLSALADGDSFLINPLRSEDTEHTVRGLKAFGVPITWKSNSLRVCGRGGKFREGSLEIFTGSSGTSMRFLTALAALREGRTLLNGDERMKRRPVADLLAGLEALGVRAYSLEGTGCPPVMVESNGLDGGTAVIRADKSSQFLSALLMVAPYAQREVSVEVNGHLASRPYVDMTLHAMQTFGVKVETKGCHSFYVRAGQRYIPREYQAEADATNASYFFSAAAVTRGKVRVENFGPALFQGDASFLAVLESMGCKVIRGDGWEEVRGGELHGIEIDMNEMPDLVPTLAVTAAFAKGETVMKNIGHLRIKESDRLGTVARELIKMGIRVEEGKDWLKVEGGEIHGAEIETYNDHRLAMSFAVAGLAVPGVKIRGERCVDKSFPGFWETLEKLY